MKTNKKFILLLTLAFLSSACQPSSQATTKSEKGKHTLHEDMDMTDHSANEEMDMSELSLNDMDMSDLQPESAQPKDAHQGHSPSQSEKKKPEEKKTPGKKKIIYRGPMHPWITSDKPGKCPICHMDLEPVEVGEDGEDIQEEGVKGLTKVKISSRKQQLIGVKTDLIQKRVLKHTIRTVGKIDFNEQAVSLVHTKYDGWLENVYVDFKGKYVKKGQALFDIYSPELVAAQKEYLIALKTRNQFQDPDLVATEEMGRSLVEAARQKLRLWDLSGAQIERLAYTGQIQKNITVYAPDSGYVIETNALKGMRVTAGTRVYKIANLSTVWVNAQVYEYEIPQVQVGQLANISLSYLPGKKFSGRIGYIDPFLDPKSRTARVRIDLINSQGQLKPDMFADVEIETNNGQEALTIPISAVMDSGKRKIIYLAQDDGYFEPKEITVGARLGHYYVLETGPGAGTKVVVDANFLIDAESQLNAAISGMGGGHNH